MVSKPNRSDCWWYSSIDVVWLTNILRLEANFMMIFASLVFPFPGGPQREIKPSYEVKNKIL